MSGIRPRLSHAGPNTYPVGAAIKGGQVVEGRADGLAYPAADGSTSVLGVAEHDAKPWTNPVTTDADGFEVVNVNPLPDHTSVGFARYEVTYAEDCPWGAAIVAAANGAVRPYRFTDPDGAGALVADTDPRLIIGYCDEPGGVVVATKATGLANISR